MFVQGHKSREVPLHQIVAGYGMSRLVISQAAPFYRCQLSELAQAKFVYILCLYEVSISDHFTLIEMCDDDRFIDDVLDCHGSIFDQALHHGRY